MKEEALRLIDDKTFQEADPPEDRSRPLEWRRSFKSIAFDARAPAVATAYIVNEVSFYCDPEAVTGAARRRVSLNLELPQEKLRDRIRFTEETEKGSGIYRLRRPDGVIKVCIAEAEPTEAKEPYALGAYAGLAFADDGYLGNRRAPNSKESSKSLCIEVGAPAQQIDAILAELRSGYANSLRIAIGIQAFSSEVEDALREWYHPQDLFIHGFAAKAVLLSISSRFEPEEESAAPEAEETEPSNAELSLPPVPPADYSPILKSIKTALWVVAGLLLLRLLK